MLATLAHGVTDSHAGEFPRVDATAERYIRLFMRQYYHVTLEYFT